MEKRNEVKAGVTRCDYCPEPSHTVHEKTGEALCLTCAEKIKRFEKEAEALPPRLKSAPPKLSGLQR